MIDGPTFMKSSTSQETAAGSSPLFRRIRATAGKSGSKREIKRMATASLSRRRFLKRAALAIPFAAAAPYMRTSYSAGRLTLGCWDHWVPGANDVLTAICNEWGAANHVDVQIDFVTSIGQKNLLTASAEAQARAGHDIFAHPSWQVQVHRAALEPVDDVVDRLVKEHGPVAELARYLALDQGTWKAVPRSPAARSNPAARASISTSNIAMSTS
jgi:hypothetical protein